MGYILCIRKQAYLKGLEIAKKLGWVELQLYKAFHYFYICNKMGSSYWSHNIIRLVYNIITFSIPTWDQHLNTTSSTRSHFQRFNSANMHFASVTKIEPKKSGQKSSPTTKDIRVAYKCKHMKSLFEWTLVVRKSRFS